MLHNEEAAGAVGAPDGCSYLARQGSSTTRRGIEPNFAEDRAMRVECSALVGFCQKVERVARTAQPPGRSPMVIPDGIHNRQAAAARIGGRG